MRVQSTTEKRNARYLFLDLLAHTNLIYWSRYYDRFTRTSVVYTTRFVINKSSSMITSWFVVVKIGLAKVFCKGFGKHQPIRVRNMTTRRYNFCKRPNGIIIHSSGTTSISVKRLYLFPPSQMFLTKYISCCRSTRFMIVYCLRKLIHSSQFSRGFRFSSFNSKKSAQAFISIK